MQRSDRDENPHKNAPGDAQPDASTPSVSNADADDSAAHIAELVRRTAERVAAPSPSCVPPPTVDSQPFPVPARSVAPQVANPVAIPDVRPGVRPGAHPGADPVASPVRPAMRRASRRMLVGVGAVVVLIGIGVAMSDPFGTDATPSATAPLVSAPARYDVKVTDAIADCASHARGQAKDSFAKQNCVKAMRSVATGQIKGRPALFVASRIQMASAETAASIKQVLDESGTGNLNDLLREGKTFPGAPVKMPDSGYVSVQTGSVVTVAEAGFADGGGSLSTDPALRAAAAQVAAVISAQK